jgi:HAD superfamily hydrolase (TIGR01549 family)
LSVLAILDVDGTLVDTNYHHAVAWYRALRRCGRVVPLATLHRHMGMGGDQLVEAVTDEGFEREHGDAVREAEKELYGELIGEVAALEHASELIAALRDRGCRVVLASSAKEEEVRHYVEMLEADDLPYTTSADVEATKPQPDLVLAALEKGGRDGEAILVGDSTWDCKAAARAGVRTLGVLTGGFSREELLEAGAAKVYDRLGDLIDDLGSLLDAAAPAGSTSAQ